MVHVSEYLPANSVAWYWANSSEVVEGTANRVSFAGPLSRITGTAQNVAKLGLGRTAQCFEA